MSCHLQTKLSCFASFSNGPGQKLHTFVSLLFFCFVFEVFLNYFSISRKKPNINRFHPEDMNTCAIITVLLVYFAWNVCFCDENAAPKVFLSPEKYRLPRSVFPEIYKLTVFTHINDEEGFKFYGDVRIKVIIRLLTDISCVLAYSMCIYQNTLNINNS